MASISAEDISRDQRWAGASQKLVNIPELDDGDGDDDAAEPVAALYENVF